MLRRNLPLRLLDARAQVADETRLLLERGAQLLYLLALLAQLALHLVEGEESAPYFRFSRRTLRRARVWRRLFRVRRWRRRLRASGGSARGDEQKQGGCAENGLAHEIPFLEKFFRRNGAEAFAS